MHEDHDNSSTVSSGFRLSLRYICTLKSTSRQISGKGAIRKRFPLQKPRWEKTKFTIRYLYHENISQADWAAIFPIGGHSVTET